MICAHNQPIYDICEALGLKIFVVDNVEADDVIGTLATQAEAQGIKTVVSTAKTLRNWLLKIFVWLIPKFWMKRA